MKGVQKMYEIFEQLLREKGVTPYRVAKDSGVTQTSLSNWKSGKSVPSFSTLQKIADYFDVTVDYLMTGKEEKQQPSNDFSELEGVYLSYAKEAQENGIDPEDIKLAIETIKRLRGE